MIQPRTVPDPAWRGEMVCPLRGALEAGSSLSLALPLVLSVEAAMDASADCPPIHYAVAASVADDGPFSEKYGPSAPARSRSPCEPRSYTPAPSGRRSATRSCVA